MNKKNFVFTSESVSEGHPDKVSDQISDAILDAHLAGDPESRVACETLVKNNTVILAGEITSNCKVDYDAVVRETIKEIGYTYPALGFDAEGCDIQLYINRQSSDISQGVTEGEGMHNEQGAGDQGLMFGFACDETPEYMPLPIALSHRLIQEFASIRKKGEVDFLRPDAKVQVSVAYEKGRPKYVDTIVLSSQHTEETGPEDVKKVVMETLVPRVVPEELLTADTIYHVNPTGRFVIGGPVGDCGLTGRKIIVDTYGGYGRHGGGAFSGKDASKVDRSAAYGARYIAKNIVAAGLATHCEVQLAYAIGVAEPVSILVDTFGTGSVADDEIAVAARELFPLTPRALIEELDLKKPIFKKTAAYGHFGRTPSDAGHFSWEKTDRAAALKDFFLNLNKKAV